MPLTRRGAIGTIGGSVLVTSVGKGSALTGAANVQEQENGYSKLIEIGDSTTIDAHDTGDFAGIPIGGIACGTIYCSADGRLWIWDIFNEHHEGVVAADKPHSSLTSPHGGRLRERDGANYAQPPIVGSGPWQVFSGATLELRSRTKSKAFDTREMNANDWQNVQMLAQPPRAKVQFLDRTCPVKAELAAWSPYIPTAINRSSYPAIILDYELTNEGSEPLYATMRECLENRVLRGAGERNDCPIINEVFEQDQLHGVHMSADESRQPFGELPNTRERADFGSMTLAVLGEDATANAQGHPHLAGRSSKRFEAHPWAPPIGSVQRSVYLQPGERKTVTFIISWYFPNLRLQAKTWDNNKPFEHSRTRRHYAARFSDSKEVAQAVYAGLNDDRICSEEFHKAWYNSTLPHWLLEQVMSAASALQTNTVLRFENGRMWAWEGIGCCPGTCTHVWQYAQSVARLFPDLERREREEVDLGIALGADGRIATRAEFDPTWTADGQAGSILRAYREHLCSPDNSFLERVWPQVVSAMEFLIDRDAEGGKASGVITGKQHNTLDADWYGAIPFLSSLYAAALHACTAMAQRLGDDRAAQRFGRFARLASKRYGELFDRQLQHYVQRRSSNSPPAIGQGRGCHIDQAIGQWWARQLGLGQIFDPEQQRAALHSIFRLNHYNDVEPVWDTATEPSNRPLAFALPGEGGTVTCAWAPGVERTDDPRYWMAGYFNSCMTGFEFQLAGHMIWESQDDPELLEKGLRVARTVFDRYSPTKRNPFNMIEASDHYARAMSAHAMYLALCGFEYDGPAGHIGFRPRLTQAGNRFRAVFTSAQGWGVFEQGNEEDGRFSASLNLLFGKLKLNTVALRPIGSAGYTHAIINGGLPRPVRQSSAGVDVALTTPISLVAGESLSIALV